MFSNFCRGLAWVKNITNITNMSTCFYVIITCFYSCLVRFGSLCMLAPPGPVAPLTDLASRLFQTRSCLSSLLAALPLTMRLYRPCRTALDSRAIPAQSANCRDHLQIAHGDKERVEPCQILMTASLVHPSWVVRLAWTFGISFPNSSCMAAWCSLRARNPRIWPLYPPVEIAWDSTKPFNNFCPGWIFESLRHPKRVASLPKHLQEPHEAHFRLLTHIKLHQARFISVLYETVKHLLVNVFWTTEILPNAFWPHCKSREIEMIETLQQFMNIDTRGKQ